MATQILMPALSPTMTEGKLARWLKEVGDEVRAGDVIAEIETDKATMEVEAVDEGKLARILVEEGTEGVAVNTPIAVLSMNGEDVSGEPAAAPPGSSGSASAEAPALSRPSSHGFWPIACLKWPLGWVCFPPASRNGQGVDAARYRHSTSNPPRRRTTPATRRCSPPTDPDRSSPRGTAGGSPPLRTRCRTTARPTR